MPEGDTIYKLAAALSPELCGQRIESLWIRRHPAAGARKPRVERVRSHGKHLSIDLDDGRTIRSHLGLYGAWHRYRPGEPWRKPRRQASLVIQLVERLYVCFNAKEVEVAATEGFHARDLHHRLGPDLTHGDLRLESIERRIQTLMQRGTLIVDLLLDQRIASGIGNIYKSEGLFLEGLSPRALADALPTSRLLSLYETAGQLIRRNLGAGPRATRDDRDGRGSLWVYRRADHACLRCGTPILRAMLGRNPRSTYWCPGCQPDAAEHQPA